MAENKPTKIVYLFGAGATHAELQNLDVDLIQKNHGLLISHVSSRVMERARKLRTFRQGLGPVSSASGSLNVEMLISLIENSKSYHWESKTQCLKRLVQKDIENILSKSKLDRFYLHKALFEFHNQSVTKEKEEIIGLISLNYDNVVDTAFEEYYGPANYCFTLEAEEDKASTPPLLKLHGSFNWKNKMIRGRRRTIEIIPLGSTKNYIHPPYSCIWNNALETLIACDVLRVIGCSLSQNDFHLIDLLFKAHLEKGSPFEIEIIAPDAQGMEIQNSYGFFPGLKHLTAIRSNYDSSKIPVPTEDNLVPEPKSENPFKTWLRYKSVKMLGENRARRTKYLRKVVDRGGL